MSPAPCARCVRFAVMVIWSLGVLLADTSTVRSDDGRASAVSLSDKHVNAVNRPRRIVVNLDTGWGLPGVEKLDPAKLVDAQLEYLVGMKASQVDSIFWCWGEMNYAPYPSKILPVNEGYQQWLRQGLDPLPICIEKCRAKKIEAFYSFRINGANDFGDWRLPSILKEHPSWGIPSPYWPAPWKHCNFALEGVRKYKLAVIREVAERYDFDGIEIDWRCGLTSLPIMRTWENRNCLTEFMRSVREMLQEVAKRRGRPYLLAARVPENIEGCHYDGIDVERWVAENLVDILALGCKSFEVDFDAFKRLTNGTHVKLYPSMDDHHRASGYDPPSLEVYRGAASTFLQQGADGIYAFNWYPVPVMLDTRAYPAQEKIRQQALCEMGSPDTLQHKDKIFVTERRGGGGWPDTAEHYYANTSAFAQLPLELIAPKEKYVFLRVGDDVNALAKDVTRLELRIQCSPAGGGACSPAGGGASASAADPLRVRINGALLEHPLVQSDWFVYDLKPVQLAHGRNVVALLKRGGEGVVVEKVEIHVAYK